MLSLISFKFALRVIQTPYHFTLEKGFKQPWRIRALPTMMPTPLANSSCQHSLEDSLSSEWPTCDDSCVNSGPKHTASAN